MADLLSIRLLGGFQVLADHAPVPGLNSPRLQALLGYLLLHRQVPVARQQLAFLFWPDSTERQAYTNLRQILHTLRTRLPKLDHYLAIDEQTLQWRATQPYELDVAEFEEALARSAQTTGAGSTAALEAAAAQYGGDLLPALYDDWVLLAREQLSQRYAAALEALIQLHEHTQNYGHALEYAQRLQHHAPFHETTYCTLMRLHVVSGNLAAALHTYHRCAELLDRELAVEPSAATQAMYMQLLKAEKLGSASAEPRRPLAAPLVGRKSEFAQLRESIRSIQRGGRKCVVICGEAGAGKTRLAEELLIWAEQSGIVVAKSRAYAAEGGMAYMPVIDWLRSDTLLPYVAALEPVWRGYLARLMPELASASGDIGMLEADGAGWQRQHLFEAMARAVQCVPSPLLLVLDDLQWCDGETLEWLSFLLRNGRTDRLLLVSTLRPEEVDGGHPAVRLCEDLRTAGLASNIELGPLSELEVAQLASQIAGGEIDGVTLARLTKDTAGNPLFVVESIRALDGSGPASTSSSIPPAISSVILARLHRLSPQAQELAALAAVVGRSFSFDLLAAASGSSEDDLVGSLDELWRRRIVCEQGAGRYDFGHDRIREVAYAAVAPARRRMLHKRIAWGLKTIHLGSLSEVAGLLAEHYAQAGVTSEALHWSWLAVEEARQRFAQRDAAYHARKGLILLDELPNTTGTQRQRLMFSTALAGSRTAVAGILDPEVLVLFTTAQQIAEQLGEGVRQYEAQRGLWGCYLNRLWVEKASQQARANLALAEALQHPRCLRDAYGNMGLAAFEVGQFEAAVPFFEQAIAQVVLPETPPLLAFGFELGLDAPFLYASTEALLGYPEQARKRLDAARAYVRTLPDFFTRHITLIFTCQALVILRDFAAVELAATEMVDLSTRFGLFGIEGEIFLEWSLAMKTRTKEPCCRLRQQLARYQLGDNYQLSFYYGLAAEAHAAAGLYDNALQDVDMALAIVERSGEQFWSAELLRVKGEVLCALGDGGSEIHFEHAIALARKQRARLLEMRSAVSQGRCWAGQGRRHEAHKLVADVYGRFPEGGTATDLGAAAALLAELHAQLF